MYQGRIPKADMHKHTFTKLKWKNRRGACYETDFNDIIVKWNFWINAIHCTDDNELYGGNYKFSHQFPFHQSW